VVPIADGHSISIGVTTIRDCACFGIYADRDVLPDADLLAGAIHRSVDELLGLGS
jgi:diacylglycerol O-acyltransferase